MRDLRDQEALGALILVARRKRKLSMCEAADLVDTGHLGDSQLVGEADGVYIGPIERYGDPRERHRALTGGC